ncbi:unnamed protein product [Prorocentrum cordatum]|uniref:Uncharacterized protein n=1 Tax=Prorocentrum cordatum TaxID=2364126 RepID=A0ABN9X248_9DINO|nr:unnamed protein product [Polarella glacialis]
MAVALRTRWGKVFQRRGVDEDGLKEWLGQDSGHRPLGHLRPFPPCSFRVQKHHYQRCHARIFLLFAGARQALAVETLYEVFGDTCSEDGPRRLHEFAEDVNHSLLFFIPKGPPERSGQGEVCHAVDRVGPLNVTHADDRLLANAARMVVEDAVAARITQRELLPGRCMLSTLIDVEEGVAQHYVDNDGPMAIFFDFEAALPSTEHGFLLQHRGEWVSGTNRSTWVSSKPQCHGGVVECAFRQCAIRQDARASGGLGHAWPWSLSHLSGLPRVRGIFGHVRCSTSASTSGV